MHIHPFPNLRSRKNQLTTALFTKEDGTVTDECVQKELGASAVVALRQVHGNRAVVAREGIARTVEADAVATDVPDLVLTIRTADCQSFLVYAPVRPGHPGGPDHQVVGLIHAGWKGLRAGVIPSFFDLLWEEWRIRPEDTTVAAGPSLCQACSEFSDPPNELPGVDPRFFRERLVENPKDRRPRASETSRVVDLRGIAEEQLWNLGVREGRFARHKDCTRCRSRTYWTYRGGDRDAVNEGSTNFLACVLRAQ